MDIFSVYILIYKNIDNLKKTIESICMQSYESVELIISDDHSTDDYKSQYKIINEIVEPYRGFFTNIVINVNKENMGTVKHLNRVLPMGSGKYVALLGCGDGFYKRNTLQNVVEHLKKEQGLVCTSRRIMYYSKDKYVILPSKRICKYFYKTNQHLIDLCCREVNYIVTIGSFFVRDIFDKYGYFDERYILLEDAPFFLNLLFHGEHISFMDEITCFYEKGGISNRKKVDKRLLEDSKRTLILLKYPNRNLLSFFSKRVVSLKYGLRLSTKKVNKLKTCFLYPDAVIYMIFFCACDSIMKYRYIEK